VRVEITQSAKKDLRTLDSEIRERVLKAIKGLQEDPRAAGLAKIKKEPGKWRLRVGDWRVIMTMDQATRTIYILRVRHRSKAYR
jgi:mRNA interferase RelE/StbE